MNRAERAQERRQEGARHVSGGRGAENREGHPAGRTEGASDLRCVNLPELDQMSREGWARAAAKMHQIEDDGFVTVHPRVTP